MSAVLNPSYVLNSPYQFGAARKGAMLRQSSTAAQLGIADETWSRREMGTRLGAISTTVKSGIENLRVKIYGSDNDKPLVVGPLFYVEVDFIALSASTENSLAVLDNLADLRWVREKLGLSMTDLATLFGVTRKTVYDWFDGTKPRQLAVDRIAAIRAVAESCPPEFLGVLNQFWSTPVGEGPSLIDILKSPGSSSTMLSSAKTALDALVPRIAQSAERNRAKPTRDAFGHAHNDDLFRSL